MKELHFYLLAIVALCVAGFSVGLMTTKMKPHHDGIDAADVRFLKRTTVLELFVGVATWGYALAWFFHFIDGPYLVFVPGVIVWLYAYIKGGKFYLNSFAAHTMHLGITMVSAVAVIGGFYLVDSLKPGV